MFVSHNPRIPLGHRRGVCKDTNQQEVYLHATCGNNRYSQYSALLLG